MITHFCIHVSQGIGVLGVPLKHDISDNKVHGANMGPQVGPMNFAIRDIIAVIHFIVPTAMFD